jgi:hypothetical protein
VSVTVLVAELPRPVRRATMQLIERAVIIAYADGTFHVADPAARRGSDRMGANVPDMPALWAWCVQTARLNARLE